MVWRFSTICFEVSDILPPRLDTLSRARVWWCDAARGSGCCVGRIAGPYARRDGPVDVALDAPILSAAKDLSAAAHPPQSRGCAAAPEQVFGLSRGFRATRLRAPPERSPLLSASTSPASPSRQRGPGTTETQCAARERRRRALRPIRAGPQRPLPAPPRLPRPA